MSWSVRVARSALGAAHGVGLRRGAVAVGLGVATVVAAASPALAHSELSLIKSTASWNGQQATVRGAVHFTDGDPNTESTVQAIATSGARRVVLPMRAQDESGNYVGSAKLAPGSWQIQVVASGESKGKGSVLTVAVPAAATPAVPVTPSVAGPAPAPATVARPDSSDSAFPIVPVALGGIAAAALAGGGVVLARRRGLATS